MALPQKRFMRARRVHIACDSLYAPALPNCLSLLNTPKRFQPPQCSILRQQRQPVHSSSVYDRYAQEYPQHCGDHTLVFTRLHKSCPY